MPKTLKQEIVIPAGFAKAFKVGKGEILRIGQVEGGQVGDVINFTAKDYHEDFHVTESLVL